ncbi:hypothetical protein HK100_011396 [Physocladia obscura]|uniref:Methyltransferase type 11 domain-containing protein n=1 Tax=Physocladia obscura TaxID=109957 RepID=A0AAD5TCQ2_9FUNG|nr:hypothetical protein HK100_011396 [Physocladia obscura]
MVWAKGLWTNGITQFPEACENLAIKVAGGRVGMRVMVTSEKSHAQISADRIARKGWTNVIVNVGDATNISSWRLVAPGGLDRHMKFTPFADSSVDSAISLDACYHFNTRQKFLKLCASKLKTGGLLSLSDIILGSAKLSALDRIFLRIFVIGTGVPMVNLVRLSEYEDDIKTAGFVNVEIEDVTDNVFGGLASFIRDRDTEFRHLLNWRRWLQYRVMRHFLEWVIAKGVLRFVVTKASYE